MEVRFETGLSLAVFSETTTVEFTEQGPRSVVRNVLSCESLSVVHQWCGCGSDARRGT